VLDAGEARARIWRLYMAASALNFDAGRTQIHQVLAVKNDERRAASRSELGSDGSSVSRRAAATRSSQVSVEV
jgi:hypothetical protein